MKTDTVRAPTPRVLVALALAGGAAVVADFVLRLGSDHGGPEPGLQAALLAWITFSYVLSGLVAWWRRPESRLGPLMMLAGFLRRQLPPEREIAIYRELYRGDWI